MEPDFEKMNGLVPAVVQDVKTKQVLMLAYVNEEAYEKMLETGDTGSIHVLEINYGTKVKNQDISSILMAFI